MKILPGARHQAMGGSQTGAIDEAHTLFANPAATGFLREWQWATTYTKWFADIYNLSFIYGRKLTTPWSNRTRLAFGMHYQGVGEFESTSGLERPASANDLLLTASIGNPLHRVDHLSVGAGVKYLRTELANFTASSVILDLGLLYRSNQIHLKTGPFEYGILSGGVAVTQLGTSLNFISDDTPLPRTFRAGLAFNLGSHDGLQLQLTGDYRKVRDEVGRFSLGGEFAWKYGLALRTGYNFNSEQLNKFSFGLSFRLDDRLLSTGTAIPGTNNAMRFDMAGLEKSDLFPVTFRASVNHYPIAPERFDIVEPFMNTHAPNDSISLSWQTTHDPDLFDTTNYALFVVKDDSLALKRLIETSKHDSRIVLEFLEKTQLSQTQDSTEINYIEFVVQKDSIKEGNGVSEFMADLKLGLKKKTTFMAHKTRGHISHTLMPDHSLGDYYWTILAYDRDQHLRFADEIGHFKVELPDIEITILDYTLTAPVAVARPRSVEECGGEILVAYANKSDCPAKNFSIKIYETKDAETEFLTRVSPGAPAQTSRKLIYEAQIREIQPGARDTLRVAWTKSQLNTNYNVAVIDEENNVPESDEFNNIDSSTYPFPDLKLSLETSPRMVQPGDDVTLKLNIRNLGPVPAFNFSVTDTLSAFLTPVDWPGTISKDVLSLTVDSLAVGRDTTFSVLARVSPDLSETVTQLTHSGQTLVACDTDMTNNYDTDKISVNKYDLAVSKYARVDPLEPNVHFGFAVDTLTASFKHFLDVFVTTLKSPKLADANIVLLGHTDSRGKRDYNLGLSLRRVNKVKDYLVQNHSIMPNRIIAKGCGESAPKIRDASTEREHAINRRVEIFLLKGKGTNIACNLPQTNANL
ncbi:PorV/PorQ family protein, partial [candidate division KSB1 bacterium]|nr:PorV/PorQ family protein [candidate division KSB1 bacterium]NIR71942.1 PorV/PorQ family protein [candidate division KSB1 bacterium]NIS28009.1 PorV/PorQ family protein [candidate division KSB1 bacterium]NIT74879.1 PorV/PorQ family protein [candidate division KSB1 bacterium]NIU28660.1 PorV/PorQ family protein [candidate division KSB1 bacterium]